MKVKCPQCDTPIPIQWFWGGLNLDGERNKWTHLEVYCQKCEFAASMAIDTELFNLVDNERRLEKHMKRFIKSWKEVLGNG